VGAASVLPATATGEGLHTRALARLLPRAQAYWHSHVDSTGWRPHTSLATPPHRTGDPGGRGRPQRAARHGDRRRPAARDSWDACLSSHGRRTSACGVRMRALAHSYPGPRRTGPTMLTSGDYSATTVARGMTADSQQAVRKSCHTCDPRAPSPRHKPNGARSLSDKGLGAV
jgi:hypothetical protein